MAYVTPNYKTKKALKQAILDGARVTVFQPNDVTGNGVMKMGPPSGPHVVSVEGPHHHHKWYAEVEVDRDNIVTKVL